MNFIYFICPEVPQYAKYCEGFYNYLTYGYKNWTRDRYVSSTPKEKEARSRILKSKNYPLQEEMKAGDFILDRIYKKVITSDCYEHFYRQIDDEDLSNAKMFIFITSRNNPNPIPNYLKNSDASVVVWKMSNIKTPTGNKYELFETLLRRIAKPYQS